MIEIDQKDYQERVSRASYRRNKRKRMCSLHKRLKKSILGLTQEWFYFRVGESTTGHLPSVWHHFLPLAYTPDRGQRRVLVSPISIRTELSKFRSGQPVFEPTTPRSPVLRSNLLRHRATLIKRKSNIVQIRASQANI